MALNVTAAGGLTDDLRNKAGDLLRETLRVFVCLCVCSGRANRGAVVVVLMSNLGNPASPVWCGPPGIEGVMGFEGEEDRSPSEIVQTKNS